MLKVTQRAQGEPRPPEACCVTPALCTCNDGVFLAMHVCTSMYEINIS